MTREERRQKREHDTKNAVALIVGIVCIVIAVGVGGLLLAGTFMRNQAIADNQTNTDANTNTNTQTSTDGQQEQNTQEPVTETPVIDPLTEQAIAVVTNLTLEQKIAQMFVVTPNEFTGTIGASVVGNTTKQNFAKYPVGGFIYEKNNFKTKEQIMAMLEAMQALSKETLALPIFLGVEEEGGKNSVIASRSPLDVENLDDTSVIGATGDATKAYEAAAVVGTYLQELGFNLDLAPVADVLTNDANTELTGRSFGSDSTLVSDMAVSALQGLKDKNIYGVVKHFPGLGATAGTSEEGVVSTNKTLEELMACELVPFQKAIEAGTSFMMVGHISVPNITGNNIPSSLSDYMISQVLRTDMGYKGIVITDAMNQKAITDTYSSSEAAIAAINAGADMILMPADFKAAYQGVLEAVQNGVISEERINTSLVRIVKVKLGM